MSRHHLLAMWNNNVQIPKYTPQITMVAIIKQSHSHQKKKKKVSYFVIGLVLSMAQDHLVEGGGGGRGLKILKMKESGQTVVGHLV